MSKKYQYGVSMVSLAMYIVILGMGLAAVGSIYYAGIKHDKARSQPIITNLEKAIEILKTGTKLGNLDNEGHFETKQAIIDEAKKHFEVAHEKEIFDYKSDVARYKSDSLRNSEGIRIALNSLAKCEPMQESLQDASGDEEAGSELFGRVVRLRNGVLIRIIEPATKIQAFAKKCNQVVMTHETQRLIELAEKTKIDNERKSEQDKPWYKF